MRFVPALPWSRLSRPAPTIRTCPPIQNVPSTAEPPSGRRATERGRSGVRHRGGRRGDELPAWIPRRVVPRVRQGPAPYGHDRARRQRDVRIYPLHQPAVFAPGTRPDDVDISVTEPIPVFPALDRIVVVDDPALIALAPDQTLNEKEWTTPPGTFDEPGQYLVICTTFVRFHGSEDVRLGDREVAQASSLVSRSHPKIRRWDRTMRGTKSVGEAKAAGG